MISIIRTDSENSEFRNLVQLLDKDLNRRNGDQRVFYAQFNKLDTIRHVIVARQNENAVACGALKKYTDEIAEIKRMFVRADYRRQGIAEIVLASLENWAKEQHYSYCILETAKNNPEAISLYQKSGYKPIPNYGPYENVEESVCMKKKLDYE